MNFSTWRRFVPLVRLSTAQCPVSGIVAQVREAAREFCARAQVWTGKSDRSDALAGEAAYGLRPPAQADVVMVLGVNFQGVPLSPVPVADWRRLPEQEASRPTHFVFKDPDTVLLWPTPNEDAPGALLVEAVYQPAVDSQQAPSFLFTKYGRIIAMGAQSHLMLMPDRPWTDVGGAAVFSKLFEDEIASARISAEQGGSGASSYASSWQPYDHS